MILPLKKEVYEPILNELEELGIGYTAHDNRIERTQLKNRREPQDETVYIWGS